MHFFLKVNRTETYTYRNLQNWLEIVSAYPEGKALIQCDNGLLKKEIKTRISSSLFNNVEFIETSWQDQEIGMIAEQVAQQRWIKAAYAHLTTFQYARNHGIKTFWNIDADDTCFCLKPERVVQLLLSTEKYAKENDTYCFSLDMHHTDSFGDHWSFGVTYTDMSLDWFGIMKLHMSDEKFLKSAELNEQNGSKNIDWFFTYLSSTGKYGIKTWYPENCRFVHYSEDFLKRPAISGVRYWKDGKMVLPIIACVYGDKALGTHLIPEDSVKIVLNIEDREATEFFITHAAKDDKAVLTEWSGRRNRYGE